MLKGRLIVTFGLVILAAGLSGCQAAEGIHAMGDAPTSTAYQVFIPKVSAGAAQAATLTPTVTSTATPTVTSTTSPGDRTISISTAQVQAQAPQVWGLNGWWTDEDAGMWMQRYAELNPAYVRLPLMGQIVEPVNDDSDPNHINPAGFGFNAPFPIPASDGSARHLTYASWLEALHSQGRGVILYIPYLPGWLSVAGDRGVVSTYPPKDLAEYRELVRAVLGYLVNTVGFPPEKIIFEPVNEPDLPCSPGQAVSCFWSSVSLDSLVAVVGVASAEARAISPKIRVAGLAACCNFQLFHDFLKSTASQPVLDLLTYHVYIPNADFPSLLTPGQALGAAGLPVILDEYGSTTHWSNGLEGAIWHSLALTQLWPSQIGVVQFVMAEMPGMHPGFNELGLFKDWTAGWARKPAYWVYSSFFSTFAGRDLLALQSARPGWELAGRSTVDGSIALWITNTDPQSRVTVRLEGWSGGARLTARDNLAAPPAPGSSTAVIVAPPPAGQPLVFDWVVAGLSSTTLLIEPVK